MQNRSKRTREKVLAAAEKVLCEEGFDGITTRRLAAVAGVSVGSIYEYFPSVQAVLYQIYERRLEELLAIIDQAFGEENLQESLADTLLQYYRMQRQASFPARVDLELRDAIDRDARLAEMTRHFQTELSERYVTLLKHYGSDWSTEDLLKLAEFAHQLDHINLKLQKGRSREDRRLFGGVTIALFAEMARHCGAMQDRD
jgi:AcrR family transcriptional regulator